jgi:hypothetical protein
MVLRVDLARIELCVSTPVGGSNIEKATKEWAEEGKISAGYADAHFQIGPDSSLNLGDCRVGYFALRNVIHHTYN